MHGRGCERNRPSRMHRPATCRLRGSGPTFRACCHGRTAPYQIMPFATAPRRTSLLQKPASRRGDLSGRASVAQRLADSTNTRSVVIPTQPGRINFVNIRTGNEFGRDPGEVFRCAYRRPALREAVQYLGCCCFAHARQHRRRHHSTSCDRQVELLRSVCSLYSRNARERPPPRLRASISTGDLSASPAHLPRAPLKMMQSFRPVWRETAIRKELGQALERSEIQKVPPQHSAADVRAVPRIVVYLYLKE